MRRYPVLLALLVLAAGLPCGCSDDSGDTPDGSTVVDQGGTPDTGTTADQGGSPDTGTAIDQGGTPDTGSAADTAAAADASTTYDGNVTLNCSQIGACSDVCAATCPGGLKKLACLINCSNTCRSKGCASAKTAFKPLYDCINKKCMLDCAQGPTPKCKSCTTTKCAKELATCNANSC